MGKAKLCSLHSSVAENLLWFSTLAPVSPTVKQKTYFKEVLRVLKILGHMTFFFFILVFIFYYLLCSVLHGTINIRTMAKLLPSHFSN